MFIYSKLRSSEVEKLNTCCLYQLFFIPNEVYACVSVSCFLSLNTRVVLTHEDLKDCQSHDNNGTSLIGFQEENMIYDVKNEGNSIVKYFKNTSKAETFNEPSETFNDLINMPRKPLVY